MKQLVFSVIGIFGAILATSAANAQGGISVRAATYGANCGAPYSNATRDVQWTCNDQSSCRYYINVDRLGDPAPGCVKDFRLEYSCGFGGNTKSEIVYGEANGKVVSLSCSNQTFGMKILSATFGRNVGAQYGNVTSVVQGICAGQMDCYFTVSQSSLGDPAPGYIKSFDASYQCPSGAVRSVNIPANADGRNVALSCR